MKRRVFRAGATKSNITPPLGVSIPGEMFERRAIHVHDELHARSLVLDNGDERIAIVVCDAIALGKTPVLQAKQLIRRHTGIPPDHIVIAATHTHEGGPTSSVFQSDADPNYLDWLAVRISDSVRRAVNNLRPARIGRGVGRENRVVFNRRYFMKPGTMPPNPWGTTDDQVMMNPGYKNPNVVEPAGPVDPDLAILAIQDPEGDPIAVLGNYTLHYVGGERRDDISADYYGLWADMLEREWARARRVAKPPFVAMMTNGCSGNINNIDIRRALNQPYPYHQMHKVARMIADESLRVLRKIKYRDWAPLAARETAVELEVRKPSPKDVRDARRILKTVGPVLESLEAIYARETVLMAQWPKKVKAPVHAFRIGDVGIVTFPGEAFVELGLEVKRKSRFRATFCIDLSDDYLGYIPTVAAHAQGGYETWRARSSCMERTAAPVLVSAALDLLERHHGA